MPQLEKTLQGNLDELERKINRGLCSMCAMTAKRGRWETTVNGVRCVLLVYEKHAPKVYTRPDPMPDARAEWDTDYKPTWFNIYAQDDFKPAPHYSISITLLDDGKDIRLCSITAGSGQDHYHIPSCGDEQDLHGALEVTLNNLDSIYA